MKTTELLITETRRRIFNESYERIYKCLKLLNEDEVWEHPNENLASAGNLILHVCGNARQWIVSGLGGETDHRYRDKEFSETSRCSKWKLKKMMEELKTDINKVLDSLTEEDLQKMRKVQVFEESGFSILIHVIEHFSYHTGQITFYTKFLKNEDLRYYGRL
jgi:uncharacterized damage-inducible protein DinB